MSEIAGGSNFKFLYLFIIGTLICHCQHQFSHTQASKKHFSQSNAFAFRSYKGGVLQNWL